MKHLPVLLALIVFMSGCMPGATFPALIPTPVPPDEDCSNFQQRSLELLQMDSLFMSKVNDRIVFDEAAARADGYSEESIALARESAALSEAWLHTRPGDDPPAITPHVQWFFDCATEYHKKKEE